MVSVVEKSNELLKVLALVTNQNITKVESIDYIRRLIEVPKEDINSLIFYLVARNLIHTTQNNTHINLTAEGLDKVFELKKHRKYLVIEFKYGESTGNPNVDGSEYTFYYKILRDNVEIAEDNRISISISRSMYVDWKRQFSSYDIKLNSKLLQIVLFQYAKNDVIEKIISAEIKKAEKKIILAPIWEEERCLYTDIENYVTPENVLYEIEIEYQKPTKVKKTNNVAKLIFEERDTINTKFHSLNGEILLKIENERAINDINNDAKTLEDFSHRKSSLSHLARSFNIEKLRELTNIKDKKIPSVTLLETFLAKKGYENTQLIKTLRSLGRIRQGYPIHTDLTGVQKSLEELGLKFPISNYDTAWKTLLNKYYLCLKELSEILSSLK